MGLTLTSRMIEDYGTSLSRPSTGYRAKSFGTMLRAYLERIWKLDQTIWTIAGRSFMRRLELCFERERGAVGSRDWLARARAKH